MSIEWLETVLSGIDWPQVAFGAISAVTGTFLGAWAAFHLERRDRIDQEHEARRSAIKKALFTLLAQRTVLTNLDEQFLARHRQNVYARHILVPAFSMGRDAFSFDVEPMLFMLDTTDADLLNRLVVANRRYLAILTTIRKRNALSLTVQRILAKLPDIENMPPDEIEAAIGTDRWHQLADLTNSLYEFVARTIDEHRTNYAGLEGLARKLYPKMKLFRVEDLPSVQKGKEIPMTTD